MHNKYKTSGNTGSILVIKHFKAITGTLHV